jgi:DNA repair photolyase
MIQPKEVKAVLNKLKKRDGWFLTEYSVNPYEGCSCNCLYCYIRGSKYGENMADKLSVKSNVLEVLEKQLRSRSAKSQYGFVAVGSATDAYMPHESQLHMTEGILKLLYKYRFPVFISTKRDLITRDIELLKQIDQTAILPEDLRNRLKRGVILSVSISTMNEKISDTLEPGACSPSERLRILEKLKQAGFFVGVNAIPILPYISDTEEELEKIISAAASHGADYILIGGLTLFGSGTADSKTLYYKFLQRHDPSLIPKYEQLYKENTFAPHAYHSTLKIQSDIICRKYNLRTKILT